MKLIVQYFDWYLTKDDRLWNKVTDEAFLLKSLGVTDVWLPPAYKGNKGDRDSGYGVYDLYDFGKFNQKGSFKTKYGSAQEYERALKALINHDLNPLADIVLNHKIGGDYTELVLVDEIDMNKRDEVISRYEIEAWTGYNFEKRKNMYSSFTWNKEHFTSVDYDQRRQKSGLYRFADKSWSKNIDLELSNYDYLMGADVDFKNHEVINHYEAWGSWYLQSYPIGGFRLDAIKHIDFDFYGPWLSKMREHRDLFVVGEYWSSDLRALLNYLMECEFSMNLFDVPLHFNLYEASIKKASYDLRTIFNNTLVQNHPDFAVTFVDNHDTQIGQSLESWIEPWFRESANALILLRPQGIPTVFYLDLYEENVQRLMKLRKHIVSKPFDYFDEPDCIAWAYVQKESMVVIISNDETRFKKIFVGKENAHTVFVDTLNNCNEAVRIDEKGIGMFKVNAQSTSVYMRK